MKKTVLGILLGIGAGIIDVTPMFIMKLDRQAIVSAFIFRIITGFIISSTNLKMKGIRKGVLIALLLIIPLLIIIGRNNQNDILPVLAMTILLGGILGLLTSKYGK